jgi:hypothetical protein
LFEDSFKNKYYVFKDKNNKYYDINTKEEFELFDLRYICCLNKFTVKSYIKKLFFVVRKQLEKSESDRPIIINELTLFNKQSKVKENIERLNNSLSFKLYSYFDISILKRNELILKDSLLCPIDGEVKPIIAKFELPNWEFICSFVTEIYYLICPKCLGTFSYID